MQITNQLALAFQRAGGHSLSLGLAEAQSPAFARGEFADQRIISSSIEHTHM